MARWTTQWFLSLQITLYLFVIFVQGNEDADEAYKNGKNLVLEYFLPINAAVAVDVPPRREKRDVEGSGEDDGVFDGLDEKIVEDGGNLTENAFAKLRLQSGQKGEINALTSIEGSGEVNEMNESSQVFSSEEKSSEVPLIADGEVFTTIGLEEITDNRSEVIAEETSTNMIFDRSEDFDGMRMEETTTVAAESTPAVILDTTTVDITEDVNMKFAEESTTGVPKNNQDDYTIQVLEESTTFEVPTTIFATGPTTGSPTDSLTIQSDRFDPSTVFQGDTDNKSLLVTEQTKELTTSPGVTVAVTEVAPSEDVTQERAKAVINDDNIPLVTKDGTEAPEVSSSPKFLTPSTTSNSTKFPENVPEPVVEEVFKETRFHKKLEAMPGNILQKENLSLAADPLLITNTRLMDSEETVQLSSSEPKRLGAYIVIGLILLSFSSLVGYITFRKRMIRKRQEFESHQESNDTEKALLSLSDYKDSSELEENHLKNNEITPIVVKSNTQINKFEKNTNFSSPKNLNTTANEKNIEKDNVLKSTAENLTQVIIEGSPKDLEEDKNVPNMEKLIVKTRIDQDSIPKKPIIINRSSTGYMPIPQDNP